MVETSLAELPSDVKLAPGVKIPAIRYPQKIQAIAKVRCHTDFGYHRIGLINNRIALFDHDLTHEDEWQELGGKPSRCFTTLKCFKKLWLSNLPSVFHPFIEAAKAKQRERKIKRQQALALRLRESMGGDQFTKMKRYLKLLLKYRCNYESIRKADSFDLSIDTKKDLAYVRGSGRRAHDHESNPNAAKRYPMTVNLFMMLPAKWRQKINHRAMPVVDGHLILKIISSGRNLQFKTFAVRVLVETGAINPGEPGINGSPYISPHKEWRFDVKWSSIQLRNGFWHLGEISEVIYAGWRSRLTSETTNPNELRGDKAPGESSSNSVV